MSWLAVFVLATTSASCASAQSDVVLLEPSGTEVLTVHAAQTRLAELERAYEEVNLRPPRAGVAVSAIAIVGGLFLAAVGNSCAVDLGVFVIKKTPEEAQAEPRCARPASSRYWAAWAA